jgi:hypothetical protein
VLREHDIFLVIKMKQSSLSFTHIITRDEATSDMKPPNFGSIANHQPAAAIEAISAIVLLLLINSPLRAFYDSSCLRCRPRNNSTK